MSKLTLEDAISHCLEVAEQNETQAEKIGRQLIGSAIDKYATDCRECAADHRQLAEWLTELKDLREENKVLMQECDRLIKEKGELLSKVSGGDVLRICQLEEQLQAELDNNHCLEIELKEAKRLLKMAVENFKEINSDILTCKYCKWYSAETDECAYYPKDTPCEQICGWKHEGEALKLIGEDEDT
jgi:hypothetical protein